MGPRQVREEIVFNYKNFINRKKLMMEKLREALRQGDVDEDIIPHLDILNSFPFCYTTSSCAGRIALIDTPLVGPKYESRKAYRWHRTVRFEEVLSAIETYSPRHTLWLKFDSFIISFSVSSLAWASFFVKLARYMNLKDSGIRSINPKAGFVNMDFMSTEKMAIPVKARTGNLICRKDLMHMISIANFLMEKNRIKLSMLFEVLKELRRYVEKNMEPPPLRIFDNIINAYREKIRALTRRDNSTLCLYSSQ